MAEAGNSISKTYDLLKWLMPTVSRFPKDKRYTLGERIENKLLDILESLLEANYSKIKLDLLRKANIELEKFRYLMRLSYDLKLINLKGYEFASQNVNEIGRLVGGWVKAHNKSGAIQQSSK
ncbi:diversity-generating retroelement protein Avd [Candidatus Saganbacteria bacterium]|nr:diversity-generating retroelement protein Avd [Candidatus Saganbacteria bacterium]